MITSHNDSSWIEKLDDITIGIATEQVDAVTGSAGTSVRSDFLDGLRIVRPVPARLQELPLARNTTQPRHWLRWTRLRGV